MKIYYKLTKLRKKDKEYTEKELRRLNKCLDKALNIKEVKFKRIINLKDDLEIKNIDVPFILKRIGIQIVGKKIREHKEIIV